MLKANRKNVLLHADETAHRNVTDSHNKLSTTKLTVQAMAVTRWNFKGGKFLLTVIIVMTNY